MQPMRPKARGLGQYGGPPGWLEESDPAGVILDVMDVPYRHNGCTDALCELNFQLLLYSKCTQPSVMSYVTKGMHGLVLYIRSRAK